MLDAEAGATAAGFKVPSFATTGKPTLKERGAGPRAIAIQASRDNQATANRGMIREVLKDPDAVELTPEAFAKAEAKAMQARGEIE